MSEINPIAPPEIRECYKEVLMRSVEYLASQSKNHVGDGPSNGDMEEMATNGVASEYAVRKFFAAVQDYEWAYVSATNELIRKPFRQIVADLTDSGLQSPPEHGPGPAEVALFAKGKRMATILELEPGAALAIDHDSSRAALVFNLSVYPVPGQIPVIVHGTKLGLIDLPDQADPEQHLETAKAMVESTLIMAHQLVERSRTTASWHTGGI